MDDRKFVDPTNFTELDCPIIMLCDDLQGFIAWGIKDRTGGNYGHSCILWHPNRIATQGLLFQEVPLSDYMKNYQILKFWRIKNLTPDEKLLIDIAIQKRLHRPWWQRSYDFIGTFIGQLTGIRWIRIPGLDYCSEEVDDDYINQVSRVSGLVPKLPNPVDLDKAFINHPDAFECLGFYWQD